MPFVDILIFAAIALFLVFRLRSILGSRDGFEQPNQPRQHENEPQQEQTGQDENVIEMPFAKQAPAMRASGSGISALKRLDPSFDEDQFLQGAASAFPMILNAYADGDLAQLRRLLGYELLDEFGEAIRQRQAEGDSLTLKLDDLKDVQLMDAEIADGIASVTVSFTSVQTRELVNKTGQPIEDESISGEEMIDIWVFERDIEDKNPNWKLVETRSEEEGAD